MDSVTSPKDALGDLLLAEAILNFQASLQRVVTKGGPRSKARAEVLLASRLLEQDNTPQNQICECCCCQRKMGHLNAPIQEPPAKATPKPAPVAEDTSDEWDDEWDHAPGGATGYGLALGHTMGEVCVRCFRLWPSYIKADQEVPKCGIPFGSRQRKCVYCSERRSTCVMIPAIRTKALMACQKEITQAEVGTEEYDRIKQRLIKLWERVSRSLTCNPLEGEIASRKRQRELYMAREREKKRRGPAGQDRTESPQTDDQVQSEEGGIEQEGDNNKNKACINFILEQ
ncbi:hypothetical protein N7466_009356 [Penicillium verhagenii]|uniref:uncharacterized protein n=1 Tax=Penicillium verhagenii TaxID=1562060 RepID=UPI0025450878|nr:uncharacterized protein N7466_009356 [Penicillium verhagenii]KAJ5921030.1 hypothetical protein N7466_009356 [Penicillium verhagenii]